MNKEMRKNLLAIDECYRYWIICGYENDFVEIVYETAVKNLKKYLLTNGGVSWIGDWAILREQFPFIDAIESHIETQFTHDLENPRYDRYVLHYFINGSDQFIADYDELDGWSTDTAYFDFIMRILEQFGIEPPKVVYPIDKLIEMAKFEEKNIKKEK